MTTSDKNRIKKITDDLTKGVKKTRKSEGGFRVSFEFIGGGVLHGKHFPERPHLPFADEEDAWEVAQKLQASTNSKEVVNIYVINAHDFTPVKGYGERKINKYPLYT